MPRRIAALLCAAVALAGCGGSGDTPPAGTEAGPSAAPLDPGRTTTLPDPDFETAVPAGWHRRLKREQGQRFYYLNSGPGYANDYGIASRGEVGLTIATQPSSDLPHVTSARGAFERIVATPDEAIGTARKPLADSRLDGAQAATGQSTYKLGGRSIIQSNMVAIGHGVIVFIEVDAEPSDAAQARRLLATVIENWQWSERAAVEPS
jgi:hypothetical protein